MSPRKASLRVAHQRSCPNATKTALSSIGKGSGCACPPSYYVFSRDREGRPAKGARVKDRKTAERALAAAQREIDDGRVGIAKPKNITFADWADSSSGSSTRGLPRASFTRARKAPTRARSTVAATRWVAPPARDRQPRATPLPRTVHDAEACLVAPLPARVERLPGGRGR